MNPDLQIDVGSLDESHRRALEEVLGRPLAGNQRLVIHVKEAEVRPDVTAPATQSLADWMNVYEGLSDGEIDEIDKIVKTRANLTRIGL